MCVYYICIGTCLPRRPVRSGSRTQIRNPIPWVQCRLVNACRRCVSARWHPGCDALSWTCFRICTNACMQEFVEWESHMCPQAIIPRTDKIAWRRNVLHRHKNNYVETKWWPTRSNYRELELVKPRKFTRTNDKKGNKYKTLRQAIISHLMEFMMAEWTYRTARNDWPLSKLLLRTNSLIAKCLFFSANSELMYCRTNQYITWIHMCHINRMNTLVKKRVTWYP